MIIKLASTSPTLLRSSAMLGSSTCITSSIKIPRKNDVLQRTLMIYQTAYASDIVIFKEAVRRICFHFSTFYNGAAKFTDRGAEPENELREQAF
ncbi:hypothetical protein F0P94_08295 [Adhaeribacter soli]|uniref:Uncharacterized protein n=2 Tax=Adhaeribacter soli TaxID=2607655 RepID=A0A5N1IXY5_9BACT|nr:hypothetical protein F0P94_08295 [Adhaeribacter soli]